MKTLLASCLIIFLGCSSNKTVDTFVVNTDDFEHFDLDSICDKDQSEILFKDKVVDFGSVKGTKVFRLLIYFPYANIGNSKLVVQKIDVSCGCLMPTNKPSPVARGETGKIEVLVDIQNKKGVFNKTLFVTSNAINDIEIIRIKGIIE